MFQCKSQVLGKYKMSDIKLPLTLEITSPAGYGTVISKELTGSIHPQHQLSLLGWILQGVLSFSSSPVLSVWALCHSCVTWLWVKKYALPGVLVCVICLLSIHRLPWWALSQPRIFFCPPQAPYYVLSSQSLSLWLPVLLHASLLPFPVIFHTSAHPHWFSRLFCLSSLSAFVCPAPHSTLLPCPRIVYFLCLACLSWAAYPVSNPSFSSGLRSY